MLTRTLDHVAIEARSEAPVWELPPGRAMKLQRATHSRWLRLREGRLWLTEDGQDTSEPPEDLWLTEGQSLRVPPGSSVLLEAWPTARFELLEEPAR